jgi:hypothetical protein
VTPSELPFEEIWLHDFEFVALPGEHPDVVCLVAHELRSGQTLRLWRDELGARPPYRTDRGVLFINFVANAECACHLALGWPLPAKVLDLSPAFRNLINGRSTPEGKGLLGALRYYGFSNTDQKQKDAMRRQIYADPDGPPGDHVVPDRHRHPKRHVLGSVHLHALRSRRIGTTLPGCCGRSR